MKNLKTAFTVMSAVLLCLSCSAKENKNPAKSEVDMKSYVSVSMQEGLKMLSESKNENADFLLLDVRRPDEYQAGHIPGAVLFTNETMTPEKAQELIPSKNTKLFVYCRSGRRSKEASQKLAGYGYTSVVEIGGILDYSGKLEK